MDGGWRGEAQGNRLTLVPTLKESIVSGFTHTVARLWPSMVDISLFTVADRLSPSAHDAIDHVLYEKKKKRASKQLAVKVFLPLYT